MKINTHFKLPFFIGFTFLTLEINAQDIITKKDGTSIQAKVNEITTEEVKYKRTDNPTGPTYIILLSEVDNIKYPNGIIDSYKKNTPVPTTPKNNFSTNSDPNNNKTNSKAAQINELTLRIVYTVTYPNKKPTFNAIDFKECIMYLNNSNITYYYLTQADEIESSYSPNCNEITYESFPFKPIMVTADKNYRKKSGSARVELPEVTLTGVTKYILNNKCQKLTASSRGYSGEITNTYYLFNGIESNPCSCTSVMGLNSRFIGCNPINYKGVLLGADVDLGGGVIQEYRAKSIEFVSTDSSLFIIPADYTTIDMDEMYDKFKNDKAFQKEVKSAVRKDRTPEFNRQVWSSLLKKAGKAVIPAMQSTAAYQKYTQNPTPENMTNYISMVQNNMSLSPEEAAIANNKILESSSNASNSPTSTAKSESSAITSSGKDGNSPEGIACSKEAKLQWENSKEYHDFYDNRNNINSPQLRNGELSKAKYADIILQHCKQYLSEAEKTALTTARDNCIKNANGMNGNTINPK